MSALAPWLETPLEGLLAMRGSLPHALLITGPRGIGKGMLARAFAASLLCEQPTSRGRSCGLCPACGWFQAGNHPDFRRITPFDEEAADGQAGEAGEGGADPTATRPGPARRLERVRHEIRVDPIRALAGFIGIGAHRAGRKLILIEPAEAMNPIAANALLKTLEEPAGDSCFLLVCAQSDRLPPTVRSRCVPFRLERPAPAQAKVWLEAELGEEAVSAEHWLALADGAPMRAQELAEPAASAAHRLLLSAVAEIPETEPRALEGFATLPAAVWVPLLQAWTSDLARARAGAQPIRFPAAVGRLGALASQVRLADVLRLSSWLDQQARVLEHPLNQRLFAEDVWLRYQAVFTGDAAKP